MTVLNSEASPRLRHYISVEEVCALIPGMTRSGLSQLRFKGQGPKFYKPTPKKVVYEVGEVMEWLESTQQSGTAQK